MSSLAAFANGGYLQLPNASFFIRTIGSGSPLIVIHGGPGLDHSYLVEWLRPLSQYRTLVFYDQLGCGLDKTSPSEVSASSTVNQLGDLMEALELEGDLGFFAHSWGAYIVLSLLHSRPSIMPRELILSNPMALTHQREEEAGQRLLDRIPSEVQTQIGELESAASPADGIKLMELALPYYVASPNSVPNIHFSSYNIETYNRVTETLGEFDIRNTYSSLSTKTMLIYGEKDFETQQGSRELVSPRVKILLIPDVGHFAFAEEPKIFLSTVASFLESDASGSTGNYNNFRL